MVIYKIIQFKIDELSIHKEEKMSRGKNFAVSRIMCIIILIMSMLIMCPLLHATAKYQEIYLMPENVNKSIGSTFTISVMYNVTDNDNTLTGVGVRLHYDSTKLTYLNATNIAPKNVSTPLEKSEDPKDTDRDPTTDRMIVIAWADTNRGEWPNASLPYKLADLNFKVNTGLASGDTSINTGITSVAAGYYGSSKGTDIYITTMPTVSWTTNSQSLAETETTLEITAQLSYVSTENDVTVPISISGTADLLTDYTLSSQTLFFPSGEQTASLSVTVIDDLLIEDDETIELVMGTPENALTDLPFIHTITIENIDEGHFKTPINITTQSVVFYGDNFSINGDLANKGDELGVFDPDGILCGRVIIEEIGMYVLTVYGDDLTTEDIDEGATNNDDLTFKVWDLSSSSELIVSGEMFSPKELFGSIPACEHTPPRWTANNDRWGLNIHITSNQVITLTGGWNLFSFSVNKVYHDSENPPTIATLNNATFEKVDSLADVLVSINDKYEIIRNFDINGAQTYDPEVPSFFNTLNYLAAGYGYWIKMKDICDEEECQLTLSGARANPSDKLELRNGWNLIGCWHTHAQYDSATPPSVALPSQVDFVKVNDLKEVFDSIDKSYSIVRNFDDDQGASTFDPNVPSFFNTLHYIGPGYGYWIKITATEPIDFNY